MCFSFVTVLWKLPGGETYLLNNSRCQLELIRSLPLFWKWAKKRSLANQRIQSSDHSNYFRNRHLPLAVNDMTKLTLMVSGKQVLLPAELELGEYKFKAATVNLPPWSEREKHTWARLFQWWLRTSLSNGLWYFHSHSCLDSYLLFTSRSSHQTSVLYKMQPVHFFSS